MLLHGTGGSGRDVPGTAGAGRGLDVGVCARHGLRLQVEADLGRLGVEGQHAAALVVALHRGRDHRAALDLVVAGRDQAGSRRSRVDALEQVVVLGSTLRRGCGARAFLGLVDAFCDDEGCRTCLGSLQGGVVGGDVGAGIRSERRRCQAGE